MPKARKRYHVYDAAAGLGGEHHSAIVESDSEEGAVRTYVAYLVEQGWSEDDALLVYAEGELVAVPLPTKVVVDVSRDPRWSLGVEFPVRYPYSGLLPHPYSA